jgi:tetratricopeptide (TPR) repeat protein
MTDLLVGGAAWWAIPAIALTFGAVFGFFPGFVLRLLVLLYPAGDPRRRELVAELYMLGRMERVEWVFQQLETALFEGISARLERRRAAKEAPADEETPVPGEEPQEEDIPENVRRRKFLAEAAARAVGAHVLGADSGSWVSNPVLTPAPGRIGMTDVRQVEAATRALRSLDYQYGGGFCRDAVVAQLSWGQQMLNSSGTDVVKQRLHVALADLHNLAGWTSFDVGLIDSARNHFGRALELAKAGESDELVANILYRMGRVYLHKEAPDDALKMFQLGQIAAQQSGSELAVAVICANQAWAYAMMGHEEQTMKLIGRTRDEFARSNHGEAADWVKFFNEDDVYSMIGTVHTVLAQKVDARHTKYAIPALTRAIDSYGDEVARNKAFNLSSLATNHLLDGDIDHGSKIGVQAVDLAQHLKSKRVRDRLEPLRIEADKRRNFVDARDLADLIGRFNDDGHGATAV